MSRPGDRGWIEGNRFAAAGSGAVSKPRRERAEHATNGARESGAGISRGGAIGGIESDHRRGGEGPAHPVRRRADR